MLFLKPIMVGGFLYICLPLKSFSVDSLATDSVKTIDLSVVEVMAKQMVPTAGGYRIQISKNEHFKQMPVDNILHYLPGMVVQGGKMTAYGKPIAKIYINNRERRLSGQQLMAYLSTLKGENIKQIEVVQSVGANQSATMADAAELRITTHKLDDGGSVVAVASSRLSKSTKNIFPTINADLRQGKWSAYAFANMGYISLDTDHATTVDYLTGNRHTESGNNLRQHRNSASAMLGVGYDFTPKDIATVEYSYSHSSSHGHHNYWMRQYGESVLSSEYINHGDAYDRSFSHNLSMDYLHQWKTGYFFYTGMYAYGNNADTAYAHRMGDAALWSNREDSRRKTRLWQTRIDATQYLPHDMGSLDYGLAYTNWKSDQDAYNRVISLGDADASSLLDELFSYSEQCLAGWVSYDFSMKNWAGSAGLRYEWRKTEPQSSLAASDDYSQTSNEWFPNLRLTYRLNRQKGHSVSAHYARVLRTPFMQMLNPGKRWQGDYAYSMGNPFLKPATGDDLGATLRLFGDYSLTVSYAAIPIYSLIYQKEENTDIYYSTYQNFGKSKGLSVALDATKSIGKMMVNSSLIRSFSKQDYQGYQVKCAYWSFLLVDGLYVRAWMADRRQVLLHLAHQIHQQHLSP